MQVWGNEEAGLQITEGSEPLVTANRFLRQGGRAAVQEPLGQVQERERKEREQRRQQRQRDMTLAPSAALDGSPAIWIHCGGRGTLEGTNPSPSPSPDPNPYPSPDSDPYPNPNPNPNPDQARSRVTRSRPRAGTASWWGRYTYYGYTTTMAILTHLPNDFYLLTRLMQGAAPLLRANRVHNNRKAGVLFQEGGGGTLLECEIARNSVGVECFDDAQPTVRGTREMHQQKIHPYSLADSLTR